jgi:hypothetical protein
MVDSASKSVLIALKVFESLTAKNDTQFRCKRANVNFEVLCHTKEASLQRKINAVAPQDSFCPQHFITEVAGSPGVYTMQDEATTLVADDFVDLAFAFIRGEVRHMSTMMCKVNEL